MHICLFCRYHTSMGLRSTTTAYTFGTSTVSAACGQKSKTGGAYSRWTAKHGREAKKRAGVAHRTQEAAAPVVGAATGTVEDLGAW